MEIIVKGVYSFWVKTVLSAVSRTIYHSYTDNFSISSNKVDLVFDNARRHRIVLKSVHLMVQLTILV